MNSFDPLPFKENSPGYNWGEKELCDYLNEQGWKYFVQFDDQKEHSRARRDEAYEWLKSQNIDFKWMGGRFNFELVFKDESEAFYFKLAYGI